MCRAGSPLAALSLKLDWSSFHSRPFLSQLVGSRGVLHRRRQPDVLVRLVHVLGVVELGSVGNGAHSTPVGTTSQKILCGSTMLSIIRVAAPASLKLSCRTESPRESLAFDIVWCAVPETQEIAVLQRHFADVSHVTDT